MNVLCAGLHTGHFSQLVWKGSREIGVGRAITADGHCIFIVCNYHPAGNIAGEYKKNVLPCAPNSN